MQIKTGSDLVYLPRFKQLVARNLHTNFLARLFTPYELAHTPEINSLAGKFAAKEATFKALDLVQPDRWQQIEIVNLASGKPNIKILDSLKLKIVSSDLSITHDGDYAFAVCVFLLAD